MHAVVELAGNAHRWVTHRLAVKANPPEYRRVVATIDELLAEGFAADVGPALETLIADLADLQNMQPPQRRWPAAKRRLQEFTDYMHATGRALPDDRARQLGRAMAAAYRLGSFEVANPLGWEIDFNLADQDALAGLHDAGLFWIGEFYGRHFDEPALLEAVRAVLVEQGLGRVAAGEELARIFGAQFDKSALYWRGLAATVATRARSFGALSAMQEVGATTYEYVNPLDERTSDVCRALDGVVFTVKGSLELRDRFLAAETPEAAKTIAPWPKVRDVQLADGSTKRGAELQVQGIAWPPLHFHCRSAIDVASWGPMPDVTDPIGDTDLQPKVRRKTKRKPKAAPVVPGAPDTVGTPWESAKAELDRAQAAVVAAGLDPSRYEIAPDTAAQVAGLNQSMRGGSPYWLHRFTFGGQRRRGNNSLAMRELEAKLRAGTNLKKSEARIADMVARDLTLHDALTKAYREAVKVAPQSWLDAERKRWSTAVMGKKMPRLKAAEKEALREQFANALRMYPPDLVRLMAVEGEFFEHKGSNRRAFAQNGTPGRIEMDFRRILPGGFGMDTAAHEFHHRLDAILGQDIEGRCGTPWKARPGYEDAPELWRRTFGDPFDAAKTPIGGKPYQRLPFETQNYGRYMWAGTWVDSYEARIYTVGKPFGTVAPHAGGPIEFIAQAATYWTEAARDLRWETIRRGVPAGESTLVSSYGRDTYVRGVAGRLINLVVQPDRKWGRSWNLYGDGYRAGLEQLYGGGHRLLREIIDAPGVQFSGDGDVILTALVFHTEYGVPLDDMLGPAGSLREYLDDPDSVGDLDELAKGLPRSQDNEKQQERRWRAKAHKLGVASEEP